MIKSINFVIEPTYEQDYKNGTKKAQRNCCAFYW